MTQISAISTARAEEEAARRIRRRAVGALIASIVAVTGVVVAVSDDADAVVPGANGRIVFASTRNGNSEIYVMNADGSNQTRLTTDPGEDILPAWSPDGTRIAWSTNRLGGSNYEIFVMNADGSGARNLTNYVGSDRFPTWSPDGNRIAYMSMRNGGGNFEIYVMNADGSNPVRLTTTLGIEDCCPDWSPDGQHIVFESRRDGQFELYTMNADGSNQRNITNSTEYDGTPGYSPDGSKIVFRRGNNIRIFNPDGSGLVTITQGAPLNRTPAYSPDGRRIVFVSNRTGNDEVFVMNIDGSGPTNLTNNPGGDYNPDWQPTGSAPPPSTTSSTTTTTTTSPPPSGSGFLTLGFGRLQWVSTEGCTPMPNTVPLDQVAAELARRGLRAGGTVVTSATQASSRYCSSNIGVHASWADLANLRDNFGWVFYSGGQRHANMTTLTPAGQLAESCGSLTALSGHGHTRGWGLFGYGNDKYTTQIQANVVSTCFAYGRRYVTSGLPNTTTNVRSQMVAPWLQWTWSVSGGPCNDPAASCYAGGKKYDAPSLLGARMQPGSDQWSVVQAYRFVTGARQSAASSWDCTSSDWRRHWTSRVELYCWSDYLAALDMIRPGTVVTDPATVAQAWGRGNP